LRLLHAGTEADKVSMVAQDTLEALADRLGETCYLARLTGEQVVSVGWAVPERGVRGYVYPGDIMPPNAAASAKAIIAFQQPDFIDRVLSRPLQKLTPATKIDPREIRAEYNQVRKRRYATCWDEIEIGLGAIACPIEIEDIGVIYALGVSGIAKRLQRRKVNAVVSELRAVLPNLKRMLRHLSDPANTKARKNEGKAQSHRGRH
jgi:DNA-binding IclR family transcriptional regulator